MTNPLAWPAFGRDFQPPSDRVEYERGVWGKVHAAASDFRWIARSPDFGRDRPDLGKDLYLGGEDAPACFQAWRNLGDRCYAVTCYPSRAIDASGRQDFLEKQVLEWRRPDGVPAVLGALLLLPRVAGLDDEIWWNRYAGEPWAQPDFSLPIPASDHEPLAAGEDVLTAAIERGRQALRDAVDPKALEQFYDQLLARRRPAFLPGLHRPLTAEALAALLLPLPPEIADRISLAGWIPTTRLSYDDLAGRWDVLLTGPDLPVPALPAPSQIKAWHMAEQLFATEEGLLPDLVGEEAEVEPPDPVLPPAAVADAAPLAPPPAVSFLSGEPRPGMELDLAPPEPDALQILHELYRFARATDRRWLNPQALKKAGPVPRFGPQEPEARQLWSWVQQVRDRRPAHADPEQWAVKVDLLRSAALVLVPEPATWREVGPFDPGSRVPALFFGLLLDDRNQRDALSRLGKAVLIEMLDQSLSCGSKRWGSKVRNWLEVWRKDPRKGEINIQLLIGDAFTAHPK